MKKPVATSATALRKQIEAAKIVISEAEADLQTVLKGSGAKGPEAEVTAVVQAASLRVGVAEKQLSALEKLLALTDIEAAKTKVETAKAVVAEAEKDLDRVLKQAPPTPEQETWVTDVVESAFTKLRTAKRALIDLEAAAGIGKEGMP